MKTFWRGLGILAFWCSWPALWLYLRGSVRTRILLRHDGTVLVVKNWLGSGTWALPGGGLHNGELADIGARRELSEELNMHTAKLKLVPTATESHQGEGFSYLCHYFVGDCKTRPLLKMQWPEILEYAWVDPSELNSVNANPDVLRAIEHASHL